MTGSDHSAASELQRKAKGASASADVTKSRELSRWFEKRSAPLNARTGVVTVASDHALHLRAEFGDPAGAETSAFPVPVNRNYPLCVAFRLGKPVWLAYLTIRAAQMIVIGVDRQTLWLWQTILFGSILFHHSNVRLPMRFERLLARLIVTPRMHGIHHSDRLDETNSNWSSLLSA